jgi:hypothetical protein
LRGHAASLADGSVQGPHGSSVIKGGMTVLLVARHDEVQKTLALLVGK